MNENQLVWINQLKKGNELAAFNLYNSYANAMYSTLTRMTGENEQAQDLLQESFIKAFKKIDDLEDPQAFPGWLKRIVVNTGIEHLRKRTVTFERLEGHDELEVEVENEHLIESSEIHEAIKGLPDGCRAVLTLHLIEGYKHKEIATQLGITESTSKTQYRHAKHLLKRKLAHHYAN